jgi:hypothetical protein
MRYPGKIIWLSRIPIAILPGALFLLFSQRQAINKPFEFEKLINVVAELGMYRSLLIRSPINSI